MLCVEGARVTADVNLLPPLPSAPGDAGPANENSANKDKFSVLTPLEANKEVPSRLPIQEDTARKILCEKGFKLELSGNEVYYTACSSLVILKNSCSKLHCQKGFKLKPFFYKIRLGV